MSHRCLATPFGSRDARPFWRLFWLVTLHSIVTAQDVPNISLSAPSPTSPAAMSATLHESPTSTESRSFIQTAHTSVSSTNSTTSDTSTGTNAGSTSTSPGLSPGVASTDSQQVHTNDVFNYYFLFLALFGVLTAVFLWWIHKRRVRRKEQMRMSGHHALERDMDGWINTGRWFSGAPRHNQTAAFIRREEGLNERGEAPPPYQSNIDATAAEAPDRPRGSTGGLVVPLRALTRDAAKQGRPPEYRELSRRGGNSASRPATADT